MNPLPAAPRLTRLVTGRGAAPPVRILHLGLGNFFRAHPACYTAHAPDADAWGIAAFTGRRSDVADALTPQDGLYTLITRAPEADGYEVIGALGAVHPASDHRGWLARAADPSVAVVSTTVTEAGYHRRADGALDLEYPEVRADVAALRQDRRAPVGTAPARLLAALIARHLAGAAPVAVMPCDNLPGNGEAVARVVRDMACAVDPGLVVVVDEGASFVTTMVDRITPRATDADRVAVARATGFTDAAPVVTEPFHEWVIGGTFPAGRPDWPAAGAVLTDDVRPHEQRKLWLLNGSHSLLAYAGSIRGHRTVSEAIADAACRGWVQQWWDEASAHLTLPAGDIAGYRAALLTRYANPRIAHRLAQIAADGSQKVPVRILPVLLAERSAGRVPQGACRVLATWICHLRGYGAPVRDADADRWVALAAGPLRAAVARVLQALLPRLADDPEVRDLVLHLAAETAAAAG